MRAPFRVLNSRWLKLTAALLLIGIASTGKTLAQIKRSQPNPDYPKEFAERFMKAVSAGQAADAFASLQSDWIRPADAEGVVEKLTRRRVISDILFRLTSGKRVDGAYEFLGTKRLGEDLITLVYLQRFEYSPLAWSFTFYDPKRPCWPSTSTRMLWRS